jgi:tetratricopeptide (TPR) repeat protein
MASRGFEIALEHGQYSAEPEPLEDAIEWFRYLVEHSDEHDVRRSKWIMNLGTALAIRGERDSDPARLTEAIGAYQEALQGQSREQAPLDWAMNQNNLGSALQTLGARDCNTARLKEAVAAFHNALQEIERHAFAGSFVPRFIWAMAHRGAHARVSIPSRLR